MNDQTAITLHEIIATVCPILGVRVVDPANAATWSYIPDPSATQAQITAANQALAGLTPPLKPRIVSASTFQGRFTQAEQRAIWHAMGADATGALGAAYTLAMTSGSVNLTDANTQSFINGLVAAGVIPQSRATAILTP